MKTIFAIALFLLTAAAQAAPFPENLKMIYVWDQEGNLQTYDAVFVTVEIIDCGTDEPLDVYESRAGQTALMYLHMAQGTIPDVRLRYDQRNYNINYGGPGVDVLHIFTVPDELLIRGGFEVEKCKRHWR